MLSQDYLELIRVVANGPGLKPTNIIKEQTQQKINNVMKKLHDLEAKYALHSVNSNGRNLWVIANKPQDSENQKATLKADGDRFAVRISHKESGAQLLIQPSPDGYQFTTWWKDENGDRKSADSMADIGSGLNKDEQNWKDCGRWNETNRKPYRIPIIASPFPEDDQEVIARIIDPEPRHWSLTPEGIVSLAVKWTETGFVITLDRIQKSEDTRSTTHKVPFTDPRDNPGAYLPS